jgi:hypothetical protein
MKKILELEAESADFEDTEDFDENTTNTPEDILLLMMIFNFFCK